MKTQARGDAATGRRGLFCAGQAQGEVWLLALILVGSAALRLYGWNWDGGQWLQPDERQVYFVTNGLGWPPSLAEALRPSSPLNPRFFAYGSLPFYLLKLASALLQPLWPALRDPGNLHLIGRPLAALLDLGTVYLTYRLARRLGQGGALLAAALVGGAVLHVQLAHFYTADVLLTLLAMLALNLAADVAQGGGWHRRAALGAVLGLALATKVSALPLIVVAVAASQEQPATSSRQPGEGPQGSDEGAQARRRVRPWLRMAGTLAVAGVAFLVAQPYALIDGRTFVADVLRESRIAWGRIDVPYTRQFAGTLPYLTSMWQTALWGLGLPLGAAAWAGLVGILVRWLRRGSWPEGLLLAWAGPYLALTGAAQARFLRYMLPLTPVLCLAAAWLIGWLWQRRRRAACIAAAAVTAATLAYAGSFVTIYARPHSWIAASEWIYRHVPAGSTLAVEEWDTALPLPLEVEGHPRRIEEYRLRPLAVYDEPDDAAKWARLADELAASDWVIIASRRAYGSIARLPGRYPLANRYYQRLFAGALGFELAAEFSRGPAWLNPRVPPLPCAAPELLRPDESLVVYDHPRVLILRNAERLPAEELLRRLDAP